MGNWTEIEGADRSTDRSHIHNWVRNSPHDRCIADAKHYQSALCYHRFLKEKNFKNCDGAKIRLGYCSDSQSFYFTEGISFLCGSMP